MRPVVRAVAAMSSSTASPARAWRGLDRAGAEKRARDILFDDAVSDGGLEENARDSHESSRKNSRRASKDFGDAFASAEELWSKLPTTWESRGQQGVELVDVLEEMNEMLERGVITADQFETRGARARRADAAQGSSTSRRAAAAGVARRATTNKTRAAPRVAAARAPLPPPGATAPPG